MTDFKNLKDSGLISCITALTAGLATFGVMTSAVASRTDPENAKFSPETLKNIIVMTVPLITFAVLSNKMKNWKLN
tara:strand:+ start:3635 stop:3862 length:228 start_codon:yes stop_codon:yes gene_type:complete